MGGLMWVLFIIMLAVLVLSLVWFAWKLCMFNQSQHQTLLDDRFMQAMLQDEMLSKKVKNAVVKQAGGLPADEEEKPPAQGA